MGSGCNQKRLLRGRLRGGLEVRWAAKDGCDEDACGVSQGCAGQPSMAERGRLWGGTWVQIYVFYFKSDRIWIDF